MCALHRYAAALLQPAGHHPSIHHGADVLCRHLAAGTLLHGQLSRPSVRPAVDSRSALRLPCLDGLFLHMLEHSSSSLNGPSDGGLSSAAPRLPSADLPNGAPTSNTPFAVLSGNSRSGTSTSGSLPTALQAADQTVAASLDNSNEDGSARDPPTDPQHASSEAGSKPSRSHKRGHQRTRHAAACVWYLLDSCLVQL